mmetsp:Transcript_25795/g.74485  ORF Transcript_25795/g.74485 Transcript_25795/m.74485 type:complete len:332 (-) Transcript_25795:1208-2203(-)
MRDARAIQQLEILAHVHGLERDQHLRSAIQTGGVEGPLRVNGRQHEVHEQAEGVDVDAGRRLRAARAASLHELRRHPLAGSAQCLDLGRVQPRKAEVEHPREGRALRQLLDNHVRRLDVAMDDGWRGGVQVAERRADVHQHLQQPRIAPRLLMRMSVVNVLGQVQALHQLVDHRQLAASRGDHCCMERGDVGVSDAPEEPELVAQGGDRPQTLLRVGRPGRLHRHRGAPEAAHSDEAETAEAQQDAGGQDFDIAAGDEPVLADANVDHGPEELFHLRARGVLAAPGQALHVPEDPRRGDGVGHAHRVRLTPGSRRHAAPRRAASWARLEAT